MLSATQNISPPNQSLGFSSELDLDVDPNGNAAFVWTKYETAITCGEEMGCFRVQAAVRSADGSVSPTQGLSAYIDGRSASFPNVAIDQSANAVFAWDLFREENFGTFLVQGRARSATGALSSVAGVSPPEVDAWDSDVDVDQDGDAVFLWGATDATTRGCVQDPCTRIYARGRSAAGALSTVQALSAPGGDAQRHQVAVADIGKAVAVWDRFDGSAGCPSNPPYWLGCSRVQARTRSPAGILGAVGTLSAAGQNAQNAQVAVDGDGDAVAVWERFGGANWRIQAATGP